MKTLLWLDLETTGLTPSANQILEVAMCTAPSDDPFNAKAVYHAVLHYPRSYVDSLDPFIVDMHTKNGLLEECHASTKLITDVLVDLLAIVPDIGDKDERPILAGSTVSFDHEFLKQHLPTLALRLSHRHYDVSALELFCQSLGMEKFPKGEAHRARDDIAESINHGRRCMEWLQAGGRGR